MMNRREFCGVMGAGALFPAEFLKGESAPTFYPTKHRSGPNRILLTRLGSNIFPATNKDVQEFCRYWQDFHGYPMPTTPSCGSWNSHLHIPFNGRWLDVEDLILRVGSESRPVSGEEKVAFALYLKGNWYRGERHFITHLPVRHEYKKGLTKSNWMCGSDGSPTILGHDQVVTMVTACGRA